MADDGDRARFTRMYQALYPRVFGYICNRIGADAAGDVAAEVFVVAWRRRDRLPASALPWLLVTARNLLRQRTRSGMREDALAAEVARCSRETETGTDEVVIERLTVLRALTGLATQDRDALMLTVWDGLAPREAARVAGCSPATFAVRLHRARRRLADALDRLDDVSPQVPEQPQAEATVRRM
jgi:RNA polymerase sigma-70 factor (ECF subfamily)